MSTLDEFWNIFGRGTMNNTRNDRKNFDFPVK